ncbi:MAG: hypothetical protein J6R80_02920 [Kiritimatiellae bacterium]|nr:hypothetical protein [Kiritimatiellia bacterium]
MSGSYNYVASTPNPFRWDLFSEAADIYIAKANITINPGVKFETDKLYISDKTASENILSVTGATVRSTSKVSASSYGNNLKINFVDSTLSLMRFVLAGSNANAEIRGCDVQMTATTNGNAFTIGNTAGSTVVNTTKLCIADSQVVFGRHVEVGVGSANAYAEFTVTNSTFHKNAASGNYLYIYGKTDVHFIDSAASVYTVSAGKGVPGSRLRLTNSSIFAEGTNTHIGQDQSAMMELLGESSYTQSGSSMYLGATRNTCTKPEGDMTSIVPAVTGRVDVAGSSIINIAGARLSVGESYGGTGILTVNDNAVVKVAYDNGELHVGRWGTGLAYINGGHVEGFGKGITVAGYGNKAPAGNEERESVLVQSGGRISTGAKVAQGITVGVQEGRKGRLCLEGGDTEVAFVRGGAGYAALEADGGRIVVQASASGNLIEGFDEAYLGKKGLQIESDYDVTISQPFTDKAGAEGEGLIKLSGSGVKTFAMASGAPSVVEAVSGEAIFLSGAAVPKTLIVDNGAVVELSGKVTLENLVVGGADSFGVLRIDPTTEITVTGSFDIRNMQIELKDEFVAGESYRVFSCRDDMSESVMAKLVGTYVRSGFMEGTSCHVEVAEAEEGTLAVNIVIDEGDKVTLKVESGDETRQDDIIWNSSKTLNADVSPGATLTLGGNLGYGLIHKTGEGTLYLTGLLNAFYPGVLLTEGVLSISDEKALGVETIYGISPARIAGGILEITGEETVKFNNALSFEAESTNGLVEVRTLADAEMPMPSVKQGAFRKRGPGTLTLMATEANEKYAFSNVEPPNPINEDMSNWAGFTVQEGELIIRADKPGITNTLTCNIEVGVPGEARQENKVQPGLVLDNVNVSIGTERKIGIGSFVKNDTVKNDGKGTVQSVANSFVTHPYLVVTNGAFLKCGMVRLFFGSESARNLKGSARVLVDRSAISAKYDYYTTNVGGLPPCLDTDGCPGYHYFVNQSALFTRDIKQNGTCYVRIEDSYIGGLDEEVRGRTPLNINHMSNDMTSQWEVVRSEFCVSIVHRATPGYKSRRTQNYIFEDSLWSCGDNNLTVGSTNVNMNIFVRGRGLRLAPYAGRTYDVIRKIRGTGGIVMDGPGTLCFRRSRYLDIEQADPIDIDPVLDKDLGDNTGTELYNPCTVQYTGNTELNGGTIDFGGFSLTNMTLTGKGGTVLNAAFERLRISNTNIVFGSGVTFGGTTRFDFADIEASDGDKIVVGRYSAEPPNVSKWRARNTARNLKATFSVADGVISAEFKSTGAIVLVR